MSKEKAVIIVSGGMDSITLLHYLENKNEYDLHALSFNYGQKHNRELECAKGECTKLQIPHTIIDIPFFGKNIANNSALTNKNRQIPYGHYTAENMKQTVVPFRNGVMLSLAIAYAENIKATTVFYGAHGGDHFIYPDCRPEFEQAMSLAGQLGTFNKVKLRAPFNEMGLDKTGIVSLGLKLNVPYENTWTCYEGKNKPCGKCGACNERAEAFSKNGVVDPLVQ